MLHCKGCCGSVFFLPPQVGFDKAPTTALYSVVNLLDSCGHGELYGNGNILGYDRKGDTYVVNPEQAYSVRKIFELYGEGLGYQKICNELVRLGCKNASGKVQWLVERIGRILGNATYKDYICYNKSRSNNYLEQKRVNQRDKISSM